MATRRQRNQSTEPMPIAACVVHGKPRWKLDIVSGGVRKRQFFADHADAVKARSDALKDRSDLGKAWAALGVSEKVSLMHTVKEIRDAQLTLPDVWRAYKANEMKPVPKVACTLRQAVAEVLHAKSKAGKSERHVKNLTWYLETFIKGREGLDVNLIGERELNEWFDGRNESPRSKKGHKALLSILFAHCWRKRYISENPVRRMEKVEIRHEVPAVLTWKQSCKAILWVRRHRPKLLGWFALTMFAGLRPEAEADLIEWSMVDVDKMRIVVPPGKIPNFRSIDLTFCQPAAEWLRVAKKIGAPLPISHMTRRRAMRAVKTYLGMKSWPQDILRHTVASNLLACHGDAAKVSKFLGNSIAVLEKSYAAPLYKDDAEKWMKILPKARHFKIKPVTNLLVSPP